VSRRSRGAAALGALALARLAGAAEAADPVRVFYPRGGCGTGRIAVEVFDRASDRWLPHPRHPLVDADTCQIEEASSLLELRVRCVDPAGVRKPSGWLEGVSIASPVSEEVCSGRPP
jgi:hypothetical protein